MIVNCLWLDWECYIPDSLVVHLNIRNIGICCLVWSPGLPAWLSGTWNINPNIKIWAICVCCSAHLSLNCLILFNVWYFQRNIATFKMLIYIIRFHHFVEILFKLKLQFLIRRFIREGSPTCSTSGLMYSNSFSADSILKM